jgi:hypothetical protein
MSIGLYPSAGTSNQALFQTFPQTPSPVTRGLSAVKFPQGWLWDFNLGDFVRDGNGKIMRCDGYTAWAQDMIKAVLTRRGTFLAYPRSYGCALDQISRQTTHTQAQSFFYNEISAAVQADPRTGSISNLNYQWNGDEFYISLTLNSVIGPSVPISISLRV